MKRGDIIIILLVVIISIGGMIFVNKVSVGMDRKYAVIKVENKTVQRILVDNKTEGIYKFKFNNEDGYVEVKNGRARMLEMDKRICPRKICSEIGWIDKKYQSIVCLPNKILVKIEST
ncbi:NusG domain II-containing protein [Tepidibacter aestuarii]|uniref:NusG domain II-containing protein n=1 Tax=Tepidibacter aestuarii TaxID=2925782 RepID=UPI0020BF610C|nr:NusG domain II-containing protein [Tepidibacter aestuarii]CAH2212208.1 NusG_II domain-containing protein [Tepidibacter aestuarii]